MSTISYKSFNPDDLKLSTPVDSIKSPNATKYQLMSWPRYMKDDKEFNPQIQGPWMTLDNYGLPPKTDKTGKPIVGQSGQPLTDRERGKLRIPFNVNDAEQKKFYDLIKKIDKKCETEKEVIFGDKKKANVYKYTPLVRMPSENPDAPEDAPVKPEYFTVKFDMEYESGNIKTKVYQNIDGDRKEVETISMDDVQKYIRYKCELRPVFAISKLYASKTSKGTDGKRDYGLGLTLKHVEVKPSQLTQQDMPDGGFINDEDEEGERRTLTKEVAKPVVDEDDNAEESEEAPKVTAKPVKKEEPKKSKKVEPEPEPEEEEEEEEEEKPAPPPKARRSRGGKAGGLST